VTYNPGAEIEDKDLHYLGHQDSVKAQETVWEQVQFWAKFFGEKDVDLRRVLEQVDLWKRREVPGRGLSSGQRRRLSLARLLISRRTIWLLDEPFAGLDANGQELLKTMAGHHIASGGAIIAAMHGDGFPNANCLELSAKSVASAEASLL
jgi:heme exporter protein A